MFTHQNPQVELRGIGKLHLATIYNWESAGKTLVLMLLKVDHLDEIASVALREHVLSPIYDGEAPGIIPSGTEMFLGTRFFYNMFLLYMGLDEPIRNPRKFLLAQAARIMHQWNEYRSQFDAYPEDLAEWDWPETDEGGYALEQASERMRIGAEAYETDILEQPDLDHQDDDE